LSSKSVEPRCRDEKSVNGLTNSWAADVTLSDGMTYCVDSLGIADKGKEVSGGGSEPAVCL